MADEITSTSETQLPVANQAPQQTDAAPQGVNVVNPEGKLVSIPQESLADALQSGYQQPTTEQTTSNALDAQYGSTGQQVAAGAEAAAQGVLGPIAPWLEHAAGVPKADMRGREEANPGIHQLGEIGGITASLATGEGEAALASHLADSLVPVLADGAGAVSRIGSLATKAAIENAVIGGSDDTSKMVMGDPNTSVGSMIADAGLNALIGGSIGGAVGAISPLWKATVGRQTEGLLKSISNRLGGPGAADVVSDTVNQALDKTGLADTIPPEVKASLSNDPQLREMASVLSQSDATKAGQEYQQTAAKFRDQVAKVQTEALGGEYGNVPSKGDLDRYTAGKDIGNTLAGELDAKVKPVSDGYNEYYNKYKGIDLDPSMAQRSEQVSADETKALSNLQKKTRLLERTLKSGDPEAAIQAQAEVKVAQDNLRNVQSAGKSPGTVDKLSDAIGQRAIQEGWTASPSSEIMTEVNRVQKELPNLKSLSDLSNYIKSVSENTASKLPFGQQTPVSRAGGIIKGILRKEEGEILGRAIGADAGAEAKETFDGLQKAYAKASDVKSQIGASLGLKASTTGYAKALRNMAQSDGESVLRRLSGKGDAAWLELVQREFPETAEKIKQFHAQELLASAKDGEGVSSAKLIKALDSMDPQLRKFAVGDEALGKVTASDSLLKQLNDANHNFSNTARTADKLGSYIPGSAVGLATLVLGHNPAAALIVGGLTKALARDVPDAARLGLLKFLGSDAPIQAGGFKAMVDFIHSAQRGESLLTNAAKGVFKGAREVLPQGAMPKESDLQRLDKRVKSLRADPSPMLDIGGDTGHYMPEHGSAMGTTAARVVNYLNSVRPEMDKKSPLDAQRPASAFQKADYNRALAIAEQPLVIMQKISDGRLSSKDLVALKNMYPEMYGRMQSKLSNEMANYASKKGAEPLPYGTRMSMSLFLGQPLDSTLLPSSIMAAQPQQAAQQEPATAQAPASGPKRSTSSLSKLAGSYQTAGQRAEADKAKGS